VNGFSVIERHAVLVAGHVRPLERLFGVLAGHALGPQVDQHQVAVGAARDDVDRPRHHLSASAWALTTTWAA
jgi:hypothetical protein